MPTAPSAHAQGQGWRRRPACACALAFTTMLAWSACRFTPALESVVDAPVTVEAAKKLQAPPDVVVTVEPKVTSPPSGKGG